MDVVTKTAKKAIFAERLQELMREFGIAAITGTTGGIELEVVGLFSQPNFPVFIPNLQADVEVEWS